eukprot:6705045-Prymnesium_polylepis.1
MASSNEALRLEIITSLQQKFELNDLGPVEHTLGVRVQQNIKTRSISLDQEQYIEALVKRFLPDGLPSARKRATPGEKGLMDLTPFDPSDPL